METDQALSRVGRAPVCSHSISLVPMTDGTVFVSVKCASAHAAEGENVIVSETVSGISDALKLAQTAILAAQFNVLLGDCLPYRPPGTYEIALSP